MRFGFLCYSPTENCFDSYHFLSLTLFISLLFHYLIIMRVNNYNWRADYANWKIITRKWLEFCWFFAQMRFTRLIPRVFNNQIIHNTAPPYAFICYVISLDHIELLNWNERQRERKKHIGLCKEFLSLWRLLFFSFHWNSVQVNNVEHFGPLKCQQTPTFDSYIEVNILLNPYFHQWHFFVVFCSFRMKFINIFSHIIPKSVYGIFDLMRHFYFVLLYQWRFRIIQRARLTMQWP